MFLLKNSSQRTVGFWLSVIGWLIFTFSVGYAIPSGNTVTTVLLSGAWVLLTGSMVSLFLSKKGNPLVHRLAVLRALALGQPIDINTGLSGAHLGRHHRCPRVETVHRIVFRTGCWSATPTPNEP